MGCSTTAEKENNPPPPPSSKISTQPPSNIKTEPVVVKKKPQIQTSKDDYYLQEFRKEILEAHNAYRDKHCAPPLKFNEELNKKAMEHAKLLASQNVMKRSTCEFNGKNVGENLFAAYSYEPTGYNPVDYWYEEGNNYNYTNNEFMNGKEQFCQMIWKESKEIGVGIEKGSQGWYYVVVNYYPEGNIDGSYTSNVMRPKM